MGRKDRWAKNGPETISIGDYIRAMHDYHGAVVHVEIRPEFPTIGHPELRVSVVAQPGPGPELASGPLANVSVHGHYPSSSHSTFEGCVYRLLVELDNKLGTEWWRQRELPF